ncbi:MAG: alkaline phosphatase [Clostridia bacterium]|nr:alkaline phosphatase [Clostridia bacterium]
MIRRIFSLIIALMMLILNLFGAVSKDGTGHTDYRQYKNVILMIGDGMGFNTVAAAKKERGIEVSMETMPVICESKTRSLTNKVTDSAAGGTALSSGTRTYNSAIDVYIFNPLGNFVEPKTLSDLAIENGKSAGVVTTDKTSGATPASFSAHSVARTFEADISVDQMCSDLTLIWGAASETVNEKRCRFFGFDYINTAEQMNALEPGTRSFGQFDFDAFAHVSNDNGTPYLTDMTTKAIELLNADEDGFFLMVEGAHIDKFSHSNDMAGMAAQLEEFSNAVQAALDFAEKDGDTLVLITADHETGGITLNEETGEYYYTKTSHSNANVPVYVSAEDAGFVSGEAYKNIDVSTQLARVMGYDKSQFPTTRVKVF